jgi:hypothetical protein
MAILTQNLYRTGHYIVSESEGYRSRDQGVVANGAGVLLAGAVLSQNAAASEATSAAKAGGNTGGGTLTLDATTPVLTGAKRGAYTVRCIAAATNGGTFRVEDPDGYVLGDVAVGATFADHIKFVIADVGTDFIVGDGFDVTVAADTDAANIGQYSPYDGSLPAAAILYESCDATSAAVRRTVSVRDCEVNAAVLQWADGVTDDQKTAALADLAALGIISR